MPTATPTSTTPDQRPVPPAPADCIYDQRAVGAIGRSTVRGAALGAALLGTAVAIGSMGVGGATGDSLGLGAAVALTGGPFFGGLVGFALSVRALEAPTPIPARASVAAVER